MLLTDHIYNSMFEAILRGEFPPGRKFLTEQEAIERYHASRITIRRAFAMLEKNHAIHRRPKTGSTVSSSFSASGGSMTRIAALVPLKSHFVRNFLSALCEEASERNIITVLEPAVSGRKQNEALIRLVLHGIRDIIIWGIDREIDLELCLRLRILGVNLTFFDQIDPGKIADYVCLDHHDAVASLLDRAEQAGVNSVFFADPDHLDVDTNLERHRICRKECERRGWNYSETIPEHPPAGSAIVAVNDEVALRLPDYGVPVFSIDGREESRQRGIVSYRQPMKELARTCFRSLLRQRELGAEWHAKQYRLKNRDPFA